MRIDSEGILLQVREKEEDESYGRQLDWPEEQDAFPS